MRGKHFVIVLMMLVPMLAHGQSWEARFVRSQSRVTELHTFSDVMSNSVYVVSIGLPIAQVIAGCAMRDDEQIHNAIASAAGVAITFGLKEGIKHIAQRQRPFLRYPGYIEPYYHDDSYSMPSGHTALAFNTATMLTLQYRRWYIAVPAYVWATGVGYARINMGVHYPSDVLAGAALGALSAWGTYELNKFIWNATGNKPLFKSSRRERRKTAPEQLGMLWPKCEE